MLVSTQVCKNHILTSEEARRNARDNGNSFMTVDIDESYINGTVIDELYNSMQNNIMREGEIRDEMLKRVLQSISNGANINAAVDKDGNTYLHYICEHQNINLALQFVEYGAQLLPNYAGVYPQDLFINDCHEIDLGFILANEVGKYDGSHDDSKDSSYDDFKQETNLMGG